jgi:hypothetical protein
MHAVTVCAAAACSFFQKIQISLTDTRLSWIIVAFAAEKMTQMNLAMAAAPNMLTEAYVKDAPTKQKQQHATSARKTSVNLMVT